LNFLEDDLHLSFSLVDLVHRACTVSLSHTHIFTWFLLIHLCSVDLVSTTFSSSGLRLDLGLVLVAGAMLAVSPLSISALHSLWSIHSFSFGMALTTLPRWPVCPWLWTLCSFLFLCCFHQ
jgi:hypothetical protein